MDNNIIDKINDVKRQADIVDVVSRYVDVIKKGRNYSSICPFHNDTRPSMSISKDKQIFKCFSCNTGGDVFSFVSKFKNIPYMKAVKEVADMVGAEFSYNDSKTRETNPVNIKNQGIFDLLKDAAAFYKNDLLSNAKALQYCVDRNLDQKILNDFNIGFSSDKEKVIKYLLAKGYKKEDIFKSGIALETDGTLTDRFVNRLIFPICDLEGHIVAFSGRIIEKVDMAKYVNSPETEVFIKGNTLYNFFNAKTEIIKEKKLYIVEGFMDCIALCRSGVKNSVALMGTAFTKEHLKLIKYLGVEVVLCLDGDNPGNINANKLANQLFNLKVNVSVVPNYNDVKDLGEYFDKYGSEALKSYISTAAIDVFDFNIYVANKLDEFKNNENKKAFLKSICKKIASLDNEDIDIYVNKLNKELGFSIATIKALISEAQQEVNNDPVEVTNNYKKFSKDIELQVRLIAQMLDSEEAISTYIETLPVLSNEAFRKLAMLIADYYQTNIEAMNMDLLLTDIFTKVETDMSGDEDLRKALVVVDNCKMNYPSYNKQSFEDLIFELTEIAPLEKRLEEIKEDIKFANDSASQLELFSKSMAINKLIREKKEKRK